MEFDALSVLKLSNDILLFRERILKEVPHPRDPGFDLFEAVNDVDRSLIRLSSQLDLMLIVD